jgi:aconitate hydratase
VQGVPRTLPNDQPVAVIAASLSEVRSLANRILELGPNVRAVVASFLPSGIGHMLSGLGVATFTTTDEGLGSLRDQTTLALPAPAQWNEPIVIKGPKGQATLRWTAIDVERNWVTSGTSRPAPPSPKVKS